MVLQFIFLQVSAIENSQDYKSELVISGAGNLVKFSEKGRSEITFNYDSSTGLLTSRSDSTAEVPTNDNSYSYLQKANFKTYHYFLNIKPHIRCKQYV